jgi:short-subunit dehydrogenase
MDPTTIVVTGASSGIGAALARALAGSGRKLVLIARNPERLDAVAEACRARGAECVTASIDVRDSERLLAFLGEVNNNADVDLLIVSAGILDGRHVDTTVETRTAARQVVEVNLLSAIDTIHAILPGMRRRRRGAIALVGSLASLNPLPDAPAYSASKAGLMSYGLALREAVEAEGIRVVVACPGFVSTGMSSIHRGPRPGEISAEEAATHILRGLQKNRPLIGFSVVPFWFSRLALLLPEWARRRTTQGTRFYID